MGNWEDDIFYENEEMPEENIKMFEEAVAKNLSGEERFFYERMREKETGEFAPSADLLIDEDDNADRLFLVGYYFSEWRLGQADGRRLKAVYSESLSELLSTDLFPYLDRHMTVLEWLREHKFLCVRYNGNYAIKE